MLALVVAAAENGLIGRDNQLPWHLPADLKHFKTITLGKPVIMGRKTFASIGKPLPGRRNLVLTRDARFAADGVETVRSLEEALERTADAPEVMVIGGAEIFRLALPLAQRIYLTRVHATLEGETFFPALDESEWREIERREHPADEKNAHAMSFLTLERRRRN